MAWRLCFVDRLPGTVPSEIRSKQSTRVQSTRVQSMESMEHESAEHGEHDSWSMVGAQVG